MLATEDSGSTPVLATAPQIETAAPHSGAHSIPVSTSCSVESVGVAVIAVAGAEQEMAVPPAVTNEYLSGACESDGDSEEECCIDAEGPAAASIVDAEGPAAASIVDAEGPAAASIVTGDILSSSEDEDRGSAKEVSTLLPPKSSAQPTIRRPAAGASTPPGVNMSSTSEDVDIRLAKALSVSAQMQQKQQARHSGQGQMLPQAGSDSRSGAGGEKVYTFDDSSSGSSAVGDVESASDDEYEDGKSSIFSLTALSSAGSGGSASKKRVPGSSPSTISMGMSTPGTLDTELDGLGLLGPMCGLADANTRPYRDHAPSAAATYVDAHVRSERAQERTERRVRMDPSELVHPAMTRAYTKPSAAPSSSSHRDGRPHSRSHSRDVDRGSQRTEKSVGLGTVRTHRDHRGSDREKSRGGGREKSRSSEGRSSSSHHRSHHTSSVGSGSASGRYGTSLSPEGVRVVHRDHAAEREGRGPYRHIPHRRIEESSSSRIRDQVSVRLSDAGIRGEREHGHARGTSTAPKADATRVRHSDRGDKVERVPALQTIKHIESMVEAVLRRLIEEGEPAAVAREAWPPKTTGTSSGAPGTTCTHVPAAATASASARADSKGGIPSQGEEEEDVDAVVAQLYAAVLKKKCKEAQLALLLAKEPGGRVHDHAHTQ